VLAVGAAAWLLAGAGACAQPIGAQHTTATANTSRFFLICLILASPLFPDCPFHIGPVEQTENPEQADRQSQKYKNEPPGYRGRQRQAEQTNYKSEEGDNYPDGNHVSVASRLRLFDSSFRHRSSEIIFEQP
jgi:hypothetical protein